MHRFLDFLPLLLAIALIAGYVAFQQPLPVVPRLELPAGLASQPPPAEPTATPAPVTPVTPVTRAPSATAVGCTTARPGFTGGLAQLKGVLGPIMGDAVECERAVDGEGNTEQKTSTGLAYYRKSSNTVAFTTGWDHWALTSAGIVHWTGDAVEPPPNAAPLR